MRKGQGRRRRPWRRGCRVDATNESSTFRYSRQTRSSHAISPKHIDGSKRCRTRYSNTVTSTPKTRLCSLLGFRACPSYLATNSELCLPGVMTSDRDERLFPTLLAILQSCLSSTLSSLGPMRIRTLEEEVVVAAGPLTVFVFFSVWYGVHAPTGIETEARPSAIPSARD